MHTHCTLLKSKFLERVEDAVHAAGLEPLQGHISGSGPHLNTFFEVFLLMS
jgi:hypothetical protein